VVPERGLLPMMWIRFKGSLPGDLWAEKVQFLIPTGKINRTITFAQALPERGCLHWLTEEAAHTAGLQ
jgi:hypothetical protein